MYGWQEAVGAWLSRGYGVVAAPTGGGQDQGCCGGHQEAEPLPRPVHRPDERLGGAALQNAGGHGLILKERIESGEIGKLSVVRSTLRMSRKKLRAETIILWA